MDNRKQVWGELIRFAIVGIIATILHWLVYWCLLPYFHPYLSYTVAYVISFVCNFLATNYVTFHTRPTWGRLWGMAGAHAFNYLLHIALLAVMLPMGVPERWAPAPVYAVAVPSNFLLVRYVFKKKNDL